jgi:hypothetical protein
MGVSGRNLLDAFQAFRQSSLSVGIESPGPHSAISEQRQQVSTSSGDLDRLFPDSRRHFQLLEFVGAPGFNLSLCQRENMAFTGRKLANVWDDSGRRHIPQG